MMQYKGYVGIAEVDLECGVIRGKVVNIRDTITFQGKTVDEARRAFEESVDDYLEFCASLGQGPEKPFSGRFLVRVSPEVHRNLSAFAQSKGLSVNAVVKHTLTRFVRKHCGPPATSASRPTRARKTSGPRKTSGKSATTR